MKCPYALLDSSLVGAFFHPQLPWHYMHVHAYMQCMVLYGAPVHKKHVLVILHISSVAVWLALLYYSDIPYD